MLCSKNKNDNGFTIIELSLVIALFIVVLSFAVPYGLRFFRIERLDGTSRDILTNLRLAQSQATSQRDDSDFGLYLEQGTITLFKGSGYSTREVAYDWVIEFSDQIIISGLSEVVFYCLTGLPSDTGEIRLESIDRTNIITINQHGAISLEMGVSLANP